MAKKNARKSPLKCIFRIIFHAPRTAHERWRERTKTEQIIKCKKEKKIVSSQAENWKLRIIMTISAYSRDPVLLEGE
jgi:hypothetical protein